MLTVALSRLRTVTLSAHNGATPLVFSKRLRRVTWAEAAAPVCDRARGIAYDYHDPWCGLTFGSLTGYEDHLDRHRHPRTAEVVDPRTGRVVDTVRWCDGGWIGGDEDCAAAPRYEDWED